MATQVPRPRTGSRGGSGRSVPRDPGWSISWLPQEMLRDPSRVNGGSIAIIAPPVAPGWNDPLTGLAALVGVFLPGEFGQRCRAASLARLGADDACSGHVHFEELDFLESSRPQEPGPFGGVREPPFHELRMEVGQQ